MCLIHLKKLFTFILSLFSRQSEMCVLGVLTVLAHPHFISEQGWKGFLLSSFFFFIFFFCVCVRTYD